MTALHGCSQVEKKMSGSTRMGGAELLKCGDGEFDKSIQEMTLKNLLDTISMLQKEMSREQASFNSLSSQLATMNKNSRQYKQISKEMNSSQARLTMLMNRSMKCFQQQGNQHSKSAAAPGVQRHNSNKEVKEGGTAVQRRHSSKVSATDGELIKSGFDNAVKASSPQKTNQSQKTPVILQQLVNNSKLPNKNMGDNNSKDTNGVSGDIKPADVKIECSDTESTSLSTSSLKSDSKSTDTPASASTSVNVTVSSDRVATSGSTASSAVLTNGDSSGTITKSATSTITSSTASGPAAKTTAGSVKNSATVTTSATPASKNSSVKVSVESLNSNTATSSVKSTATLNFGVKDTVKNLERKSVVSVSTNQVVPNSKSTKTTSSVVVKPASVADKTSVSSVGKVSETIAKPVVSSNITGTAASVKKQEAGSTNNNSSVTSKINAPTTAPVVKKVSQPSKYSRPLNEPVDPRSQMLQEIRNFKRPDIPPAEPKKPQLTEIKLDLNKSKTVESQAKPKPVESVKAVPVTTKVDNSKPAEQSQNNKIGTVISETKQNKDKAVPSQPNNSIEKPKVIQQTVKVVEDVKPEVNKNVTEQAEPQTQSSVKDKIEEVREKDMPEDDHPISSEEETFVSQVTFTHTPAKQPEIVKPKQTKATAPLQIPDEPKKGKSMWQILCKNHLPRLTQFLGNDVHENKMCIG